MSTRRNTWQREAVANALGSSPNFQTAQELHQQVLDDGKSIGLATVYRNLQALVAAGEADCIRHENGEIAYRQCSAHHHHHLICRQCGKTVEVVALEIEDWAESLGKAHGFTAIDHELEVRGLCADCV